MTSAFRDAVAHTLLVPWKREALHKSRSAAPGSQGAPTAHIGQMQGRSNAASQDAPPGNYAMPLVSRGLAEPPRSFDVR